MPRRTASDKVLCNEAIFIAENPKYDKYEQRRASVVYRFFDKKSAGHIWTKINSVSVPKNQLLQSWKKGCRQIHEIK